MITEIYSVIYLAIIQSVMIVVLLFFIPFSIPDMVNYAYTLS